MFNEKQILNNAISIAEGLTDEVKKTRNGWYWETIRLDENKDPVWDASESLYSGTGGIILFFVELYKHTRIEKYLDLVEQGAEWLMWYCKQNPTEYYAFFTGRMGVSYVMLKCYEISDDEKYLNHALELARKCEEFLDTPYTINELINGAAGTLLGLLHLHNVTNEGWVLEKISVFVEQLIDEVKYGESGIYWDLNHRYTQPLCGFSHGVSGIGYVFLELGHYFGNEAFYWIAEQAFVYENSHFDESQKNWPDFREGIHDEETYERHKAAYLKRDLDFFSKPSFMTAWCHGAPGIGLSRTRAYQLLGEEQYKVDIEYAISHTYTLMRTYLEKASYTLCHGKGGNALLFIDAYRKFGNKNYQKYAQEIAEQAIESNQKLNKYVSGYSLQQEHEDASLFMGKAGVGYFYLQCLKEANDSLIVAPSLNEKNRADCTLPSILAISQEELQKIILSKAFPRTVSLAEYTVKKKFNEFLSSTSSADNLQSSFEKFITRLSVNGSSHLQDAFRLEEQKLKERINTNPSYIYIQDDVQSRLAETILELEDHEIRTMELKLNDIVSFYETQWDWNIAKPDLWVLNLDKPAGKHRMLFIRRVNEVKEFSDLTELTKLIFGLFEKTRRVEEVVDSVARSLDLNKEMSQQIILDQIKEGIRANILISNQHKV